MVSCLSKARTVKRSLSSLPSDTNQKNSSNPTS
uniref:Ftsj, putative n=1 Tax=Arundo donax TaxID=35708 RepID=A0A0A9GBP0_ARUDO